MFKNLGKYSTARPPIIPPKSPPSKPIFIFLKENERIPYVIPINMPRIVHPMVLVRGRAILLISLIE